MQRCPVCHIRKARTHPTYGILACNKCQMRREHQAIPNPVEMVGDDIKQQRKDYTRSVIQPYRQGELSKEYLDAYGTKGIKATPQEVRKARNVWTGDVISPNMDVTKTK